MRLVNVKFYVQIVILSYTITIAMELQRSNVTETYLHWKQASGVQIPPSLHTREKAGTTSVKTSPLGGASGIKRRHWVTSSIG